MSGQLLMIRHGHAVLDTAFYPHDGRTPHDLASVTKTVTSVLAGIAVAQVGVGDGEVVGA